MAKRHHAAFRIPAVLLWLLVLALAASGFWLAAQSSRRRPGRVVLMSWDGAPQWMLQSWLKEDLPNLQWLQREGTQARYSEPSLPSKTAPAHASIWTGTYGGINGILGNRILKKPFSQNTILESQSGFAAEALEAEPIWITAARQNVPVVVVEATHDFPIQSQDPVVLRNLTVHEGYNGLLEGDAIIRPEAGLLAGSGWEHVPRHVGPYFEVAFRMRSKPYWVLFFDDPSDATRGLDSAALYESKEQPHLAILKPGSQPAAVVDRFARIMVKTDRGTATTYFRLFSLKPDGSSFLLYHTPITYDEGHPQGIALASRDYSGGFIGQGADSFYRRGELGRILTRGGTGEAEQRYLETVTLVNHQIARMTEWYMKNRSWRLLITYSPYPDEALHLWTAWLDPSSRSYRPEMARRLRPHVTAVLKTLDDLLGTVRKNLEPGDTLILTSDHGMRGVTRFFYPNKLLKDAGYLEVTPEGELDLRRTRVLYPPLNSGYLVVNSQRFRNGAVSDEDWPFVVRNVVKLLKKAADPLTGRPIVKSVIDRKQTAGHTEVGPIDRDFIFFDLEKDFDYNDSFEAPAIVGDRPPYGTHVFFPENSDMHAIFFMIGPTTRPGKLIDHIRHIDIAPTVASLLGITPPAQSMGRPIP